MGFKLSWNLIAIGLYGYEEIPVSLNYDDVFDYLDDLLVNTNEQIDTIIALVCEKEEVEKFDRLLKELASKDNSNIMIQKRKWRACLLKILINNISQDVLQGLLELMEFWISMGKPYDCPLSFPSDGSKESVQDYFTKSSYDFNLNKNIKWLNEEISTIVNADNNIGDG